MIRIPVRASAGSYDVLVGRGLLGSAGDLMKDKGLEGTVWVIADVTVHRLHGPTLESALRGQGLTVSTFLVPPGEPSKSLDTASRIYEWLIEGSAERRDIVLALGGGVIGDLAGFVAATYLRGLRFVQAPTSLLAQVDSSVGGKVAVNHPRGKNLIGSFYPPALVIADLETLSSLPRRELSAALAELVKHGLIMDADLFDYLEGEGERLLIPGAESMEKVVARSIELKAAVVEADEKEAGLRAILNYGHTIGHGVESATSFVRYRHGEAVAIGMAGAGRIAVEMGMIAPEVAERQDGLLRRLGLPTAAPGLDPEAVLEAMARDKKASRGRLAWVLLEGMGRATVSRDVPVALVHRVVADLCR